jgi:hypothetical protein
MRRRWQIKSSLNHLKQVLALLNFSAIDFYIKSYVAFRLRKIFLSTSGLSKQKQISWKLS